MLAKEFDQVAAELLADLHPLAEQTARILQYLGEMPDSIAVVDSDLAARIGRVSAQHVALVTRALVRTGLAVRRGFSLQLAESPDHLTRLAANFEGVSTYLRGHRDADNVRVVLTEPGENSNLRLEMNRRGLPPRLFQTRDAFLNLSRSALEMLTIVTPFIDDPGCEFLIDLYYACEPTVQKHLICRPLHEEHCGDAFRRRRDDFKRLGISVFEYALPSLLPSGRETFHAKVVLVDDTGYYVGSSNFMASALDRSLECGVIVHGNSARELRNVVEALKVISTLIDPNDW